MLKKFDNNIEFKEQVRECIINSPNESVKEFHIYCAPLFESAPIETIISFFHDESNNKLIQDLILFFSPEHFSTFFYKISIQNDSPELLPCCLRHGLKDYEFNRLFHINYSEVHIVFMMPFLKGFSAAAVDRFLDQPWENIVSYFNPWFDIENWRGEYLLITVLSKLIRENKKFAFTFFEKMRVKNEFIEWNSITKKNDSIVSAISTHKEIIEHELACVEVFLMTGKKPYDAYQVNETLFTVLMDIYEDEKYFFLDRLIVSETATEVEEKACVKRMKSFFSSNALQKLPEQALQRFFQRNSNVFIRHCTILLEEQVTIFEILVLYYNQQEIIQNVFVNKEIGAFRLLFIEKCFSEFHVFLNKAWDFINTIEKENKGYQVITEGTPLFEVVFAIMDRYNSDPIEDNALIQAFILLKKELERFEGSKSFLHYIYYEVLNNALILQMETQHQFLVPMILEIQKMIKLKLNAGTVFFNPHNQIPYCLTDSIEIAETQRKYCLNSIQWNRQHFSRYTDFASPEINLFWIVQLLLNIPDHSDGYIVEEEGEGSKFVPLTPDSEKPFIRMMHVKIAESIAQLIAPILKRKRSSSSTPPSYIPAKGYYIEEESEEREFVPFDNNSAQESTVRTDPAKKLISQNNVFQNNKRVILRMAQGLHQ